MLEVRIAGQLQLVSMSDGLQIEVTGEFIIESEVPDVDGGIDGRCFERAGALEDEVSESFNRNVIGMNLLDTGEVKVVTREVKIEGVSGRVVGGTSGND